MPEKHGATTIKEWLDDFVEHVRSGHEFQTSAGAEPGRRYAYLEWHDEDDRHSVLLFRVEGDGSELGVRAYRVDGSGADVREEVDALVHE